MTELVYETMNNPFKDVKLPPAPLKFLLDKIIQQIPVSQPDPNALNTSPAIPKLENTIGPCQTTKLLYLAGPMTGYVGNNYDEFDRATRILNEHGWPVINPARIDRLMGLDPDVDTPDNDFIRDIIALDAVGITICSAIIALPCWQFSKGAVAEKFIGNWGKIPFFEMTDLFPEKFSLPEIKG